MIALKSIKKKNLIFILNSPNNPSGTICKNLKELAKIAKKYNLIVLSDEIYTDLTFCNKYESISQYYPERTFISGGLSKWCGAGGWRVGFFAVPDKLSELLENIKTLASESYSTVNSPAQFAAVEAYEGDFTEYKKKTTNIVLNQQLPTICFGAINLVGSKFLLYFKYFKHLKINIGKAIILNNGFS